MNEILFNFYRILYSKNLNRNCITHQFVILWLFSFFKKIVRIILEYFRVNLNIDENLNIYHIWFNGENVFGCVPMYCKWILNTEDELNKKISKLWKILNPLHGTFFKVVDVNLINVILYCSNQMNSFLKEGEIIFWGKVCHLLFYFNK